MANYGTDVSGLVDITVALPSMNSTPAPIWMPTDELQKRIRRWGLVPYAQYLDLMDQQQGRYIELSLTLLGYKRPVAWQAQLPFDLPSGTAGHSFRSIVPPDYEPKDGAQDRVWLSIALICQQKLWLRTLQPVNEPSDEPKSHGRIARMTSSNLRKADWSALANSTKMPGWMSAK